MVATGTQDTDNYSEGNGEKKNPINCCSLQNPIFISTEMLLFAFIILNKYKEVCQLQQCAGKSSCFKYLGDS